MLECIVTKFGGSSLASDEQFKKVRSILELEPTRRFLVPSAPGKRFKEDEKVTDLLYLCHTLKNDGKPFTDEFAKIRERYLSIARGLNLKAHEGGWFGASGYGAEFDRIPYEALIPALEDPALPFVEEEPLPPGYRIGECF